MSSENAPRFAKPTPKVQALRTLEEQPWSLLHGILHTGPVAAQSGTVEASSSLGPTGMDAPPEQEHVFPPLPPALPPVSDNGGSMGAQSEQAEDPVQTSSALNQLEDPEAPQKPDVATRPTSEPHSSDLTSAVPLQQGPGSDSEQVGVGLDEQWVRAGFEEQWLDLGLDGLDHEAELDYYRQGGVGWGSAGDESDMGSEGDVSLPPSSVAAPMHNQAASSEVCISPNFRMSC